MENVFDSVNVQRRKEERLEKAWKATWGFWDTWGPHYEKAMAEYEEAHLALYGCKPS
jgi:hypothetical protein